jgi:poly(A) polymerase Pap1
MLEGRPEVSELHSIEGAKVPLMRFKFNGILVDFPYVQLPVINAAEVSIVVSCRCLFTTLYYMCYILFIPWNLYF